MSNINPVQFLAIIKNYFKSPTLQHSYDYDALIKHIILYLLNSYLCYSSSYVKEEFILKHEYDSEHFLLGNLKIRYRNPNLSFYKHSILKYITKNKWN